MLFRIGYKRTLLSAMCNALGVYRGEASVILVERVGARANKLRQWMSQDSNCTNFIPVVFPPAGNPTAVDLVRLWRIAPSAVIRYALVSEDFPEHLIAQAAALQPAMECSLPREIIHAAAELCDSRYRFARETALALTRQPHHARPAFWAQAREQYGAQYLDEKG